jgi:predicted  nucleic acid-binding Zn-ribbon protein
MGFEDIPEDREESHPCPTECGGNITKDKRGIWECDNCDWKKFPYSRTHEQCDECLKVDVQPQPCRGHALGPVYCPEFVDRTKKATRKEKMTQWIYLLIACKKLLRADPSIREEMDAAVSEVKKAVEKLEKVYVQ